MKEGKRERERREQWIAGMLWYGTLAASALVAIGMLQHLVGHPTSGEAWVKAGVALFVLLPVARLILMLAIFLYERDFLYLLITLLVLGTIAAGFLIG